MQLRIEIPIPPSLNEMLAMSRIWYKKKNPRGSMKAYYGKARERVNKYDIEKETWSQKAKLMILEQKQTFPIWRDGLYYKGTLELFKCGTLRDEDNAHPKWACDLLKRMNVIPDDTIFNIGWNPPRQVSVAGRAEEKCFLILEY